MHFQSQLHCTAKGDVNNEEWRHTRRIQSSNLINISANKCT